MNINDVMMVEGLRDFFNDVRNETFYPYLEREGLLTPEHKDHPLRRRMMSFGGSELMDIFYDKSLTWEEREQKINERVEWLYAELAELRRLMGSTDAKNQ